MTKTEMKKLSQDELVALSQDLGRQRDDIRVKQIAVADEIRARADAVAEKRAKLQAELAELDGSAVANGADFVVAGIVEQ